MLEIALIINNYDTRMANRLHEMSLNVGLNAFWSGIRISIHMRFRKISKTQNLQMCPYKNANSYGIGSNCECFPNLETR